MLIFLFYVADVIIPPSITKFVKAPVPVNPELLYNTNFF